MHYMRILKSLSMDYGTQVTVTACWPFDYVSVANFYFSIQLYVLFEISLVGVLVQLGQF